MKINATWLVLLILGMVGLLAVILFQASGAPDYHEAEPLFPIVAEFGRELSEKTKNRKIEIDDLEFLLTQERFQALRTYGFVLPDRKEELIVVRVNKTFSFRIGKDGYPQWEQRKSNRTVEPTR
jgi:hypothetical protein